VTRPEPDVRTTLMQQPEELMTIRKVMEDLPVNVLGKQYKIKFDDTLLSVHECAGYANIFGGEICIDSSVTPHDMFAILIHEVVELIGRMNELGLKHEQVTVIANGLTQFLKTNSSTLKSFIDSTEEGVWNQLDEIIKSATEDVKK
jgi:hypothetical protein